MASPVRSVVVLALGVVLSSCGDPGYSFGRYDDEIAEVGPLVDRYCGKAMECVPNTIAPGLDECRLLLLAEAVQLPMDCRPPLEALIECADRASCIDFPILVGVPVLVGNVGGSCAAELEAVKTCPIS